MRRLIAVVFLIVAGAFCPSGPVAGDEDTTLPAGIREGLERHGFAVGTAPVRRLLGVYRRDGGTVFVTTDSVVGIYYTLARRVIGGLGNGVDETLGPWLRDWDESVRDGGEGDSGRIARAWIATLRSLCTRPPLDLDDEVRAAMNRRLARLRGEQRFRVPEAWECGTRDDENRLALLWKRGLTTPRDRFFTAVHWVTRIGLPDTPAGRDALRLLARTMPGPLRERTCDPFSWIGLARVRCPGEHTVIAIDVPGDRRFPPSTLPDHAHVFGLDLGGRLGSGLARELLSKEPIMEQVLPANGAAPVPGSLAEGFEVALAATLDAPDPRAPEIFSREEWQKLALQSALAGHALFRRAAGPFFEPYRLLGSTDHAGLVHPDPEFFRAMAKLAERTAEDARRLGTDTGSKGSRVRERTLAALRAHLAGRKAIGAEDLAALLRTGRARADIESLGTELETPAFRSRMWGSVLPFLQKDLARSRNAVAMWRPAATLLDQLAELCRRFGAAAEAQLEGREIEDARKLFLKDWVALLEDVEGPGRGADDPYSAAVPAVVSGPGGIKLWQGSAGFRELTIRYPVDGKPLLTHGAVFAYREHLTTEWLDDDAWAGLIEQGVPNPPSWCR